MKYVENGECKLQCTKCYTISVVSRQQAIPGMLKCKVCGWKTFRLVNSKMMRKLNGHQAQAQI
jgi:hypothetical protein